MPYAYPISLVLGVAAALLWLGWFLPGRDREPPGVKPSRSLDAGLGAVIGGILGARLLFVLINWHYYRLQLEETYRLWQGGLSWPGAVPGVLLSLWLLKGDDRRSFWRLLDLMAVPAAMISAAVWLGCSFDGCAYGIQLDRGWITPLQPDLIGQAAHRWPTQLVGSLFSLGAAVVLDQLTRRKLPPGFIGSLGIGLLSAGGLLLSLTRADPVGHWLGLRMDAVGAGLMLLLALGLTALSWTSWRNARWEP